MTSFSSFGEVESSRPFAQTRLECLARVEFCPGLKLSSSNASGFEEELFNPLGPNSDSTIIKEMITGRIVLMFQTFSQLVLNEMYGDQ